MTKTKRAVNELNKQADLAIWKSKIAGIKSDIKRWIFKKLDL